MHVFTDMKRGSFAPELLASLISTEANPWKFIARDRRYWPRGPSARANRIEQAP